MLSGSQTNAPITDEDIRLFNLAGMKAAKLMSHHTVDDALRFLANRATKVMVRLPDSITERGTVPSYVDYAIQCAEVVKRFYPTVRDFQLDCEPNITWKGKQIGDHVASGWDYSWFLGKTYEVLKPLLPAGARLGAPPLSWSTENDPLGWYAPMRAVAGRFDFLCADCYWQAAGDMGSSNFGYNFGYLHAWFPSKPIVLAEYANSSRRPDVETSRLTQYPAYLAWLRTLTYVEAAYLFILPGATDDWAKFRLTEGVATAMAHPPPRAYRLGGKIQV